MESKLNYTVVGFFVVMLVTGLITAILWLSGQKSDQQYAYYRVLMTESVSGLGLDSAVKYLGVDVGTVSQIRLNPDNAQEVELLLQVKQNVPITEQTTATLKFFGITGLAFVELSGSPEGATKLETQDGSVAIIKAESSTFSRVEASLNTLASKSGRVLDRLDYLMNEDNVTNVTQLLNESTALVNSLRQDQQQLSKLLEQSVTAGISMEQAFTKLATASDSVEVLATNFSTSGQELEQQLSAVLQKIAQASHSVDSLAQQYAGIGNQANDDVNQSLRVFRQSLTKLDVLMNDMRGTIQKIEDSPSDILFKRSEQKLGPGEG